MIEINDKSLEEQLEDARDELAAWHELYDFVALDYTHTIFPERYTNPKLVAVATRLRGTGRAYIEVGVIVPDGTEGITKFDKVECLKYKPYSRA